MANWLEKRLPKKIREKMSTLIVTALGLFLALQYNETIQAIINQIFPTGEGILARIIYVIIITVIIVYGIVFIEKALDGK